MRNVCLVNVNQKMKVAQTTLRALLEKNVLEIKFTRRRPRPDRPPTRRMLCTNNSEVLSSEPGRKLLNFREPIRSNPSYNSRAKNIVIAWDILVQDFRCISADDVDVVSVIEQPEQFWKYFNDVLYPMTPTQKTAFMFS